MDQLCEPSLAMYARYLVMPHKESLAYDQAEASCCMLIACYDVAICALLTVAINGDSANGE